MEWRRGWYRDALEGYRVSGDLEASLLHANFIMTTSNVVVRRSVLGSVGGFRALRYVHDLDFFLRLAGASALALVDEELVTYRYHEANTIREAARDERLIVFEFGWILADLLTRVSLRKEAPDALQVRALELIGAQPKPAVSAVALALLAPRALAGGAAAQALPSFEALLDHGHPVHLALTQMELDPRGAQVAEMEETIANQVAAISSLDGEYRKLLVAHEQLERTREQEGTALNEAIERLDQSNRELEQACRELDQGNRRLLAEIERLKRTRMYRIGEEIGRTHGLGKALSLPIRVARIALEKRDREGAGSS